MTKGESRSELERRALELLPWYVNGTLDGAERELVGRQALASLTCRKELERLRRLHRLIQRDDAEAVAADRGLERLMERINSGDPRPGRRKRFVSWTRLAIAASFIAALAVPFAWRADGPAKPTATYETMSRVAIARDGARLRVVFAAGVPQAEQNALLARHELTAVGTPTADGVITLRLAEGADPARVVNALRADPRIAFVSTPPIAPTP
ncbi:MAG: hypothetical protein ACREST_10110 [Steroidobacteraceae bacterium]